MNSVNMFRDSRALKQFETLRAECDKHGENTHCDICKEPEVIPRTVKDLRRIAKERGIKYGTIMTKRDLCNVLKTEIVKLPKLVLKNKDSGEEHKFYSIYRASKDMNVNPGLLHHYMGRDMNIDGIVYEVRRYGDN